MEEFTRPVDAPANVDEQVKADLWAAFNNFALQNAFEQSFLACMGGRHLLTVRQRDVLVKMVDKLRGSGAIQ